jgi:predicted tellurium resistance membrane protein TerC
VSIEPEVHRITDAGVSLTDDQAGRQRRYLIAMSIRTLCVLGAVLAPSPWRWVLAVGAVILPYIAVVMANAGRELSDSNGVRVALRPNRKSLGRGQ